MDATTEENIPTLDVTWHFVKTHGGTGTPEYEAWRHMVRRCENMKHPAYKYYGARGIHVCERWRDDFLVFLADMGLRPSSDYSLDRIDNQRGYGPDNCRWATSIEQQNNRRNNRILYFHAKSQSVAQWAIELGIKEDTIRKRLNRGWSVVKTLTQPLQPGHSHDT